MSVKPIANVVEILGQYVALSDVVCITGPEYYTVDAFDDHAGVNNSVFFYAQTKYGKTKVKFSREIPWVDTAELSSYFDDERMTAALERWLREGDSRWSRFSGILPRGFIEDVDQQLVFNCQGVIDMCKHINALKGFFADHTEFVTCWRSFKEGEPYDSSKHH